MLSDIERQEIEAEIHRYAYRSAVGVDAMKIVQRHRGWVSDEALADIAELVGVSFHELDSVASFYNQIFRRPVGRHVIQLCDSVSCWLTGYEGLRDTLTEQLGVGFGGTTPDDRFTLIPIVCLGVCEKAPALLVDDDVHTDLEPADIARVLRAYP